MSVGEICPAVLIGLGMPPLIKFGCLSVPMARKALLPITIDGSASASRLAASLGLSVRSMQRRLADQGTSYSALLDEIRRDKAMTALSSEEIPLGKLAVELGYRQQSGLTRAVRRWTGLPPSRVSCRSKP